MLDLSSGDVRSVVVVELAGDLVPPGTLSLTPDPNTSRLRCDCGDALGPSEYLVSDTPIDDATGARHLSIKHNAFKIFFELQAFPLDSPDRVAVTLTELVYTANERAAREFLSARGIELDAVGGVLSRQGEGTTYLIAQHPDLGAFLAIRGTKDVDDIRRSLDAGLEPSPWGHGGVHSGFLDATNEMLEQIGHQLHRHAEDRLTLTGHSLGGAIATLLHTSLDHTGLDTNTITFAPAPVGDRAFAEDRAHIGERLTSWMLPQEEIKGLRQVNDVTQLHWLGEHDELPDVPVSGAGSHRVYNYIHGVLAHSGGDTSSWEAGMPICVPQASDCFAHPEALLPMCVFDPERCGAHRTVLHDPLVDDRFTPSALRRRLLESNSATRPIVLARAAAVADAAGKPEEAGRYRSELARLGFDAPRKQPPQ